MPKKSEPHAVTIGNLKRELHNATLRINDLMLSKDTYQRLANKREEEISELNHEMGQVRLRSINDVVRADGAEDKYSGLQDEYRGYRQAIKDIWHK